MKRFLSTLCNETLLNTLFAFIKPFFSHGIAAEKKLTGN
jgi:hypothetical protein